MEFRVAQTQEQQVVEIESLDQLGIRPATGPESWANGLVGRPAKLVNPPSESGYAGYINYAITRVVDKKEIVLGVFQQKFWCGSENTINAGSINFFKFNTPSQNGRTSAVTSTFSYPVKQLMIEDYNARLARAAAVDMMEKSKAAETSNKLEQQTQLEIPKL